MGLTGKLVGKLHFGKKIGIAVTLFLAPIALVLWLLTAAQNKDITFAAGQIAGASALSMLGSLQLAADRCC